MRTARTVRRLIIADIVFFFRVVVDALVVAGCHPAVTRGIVRCAPLCGCNAGYRTAIPGGKEFNVIFRHNLQERKTRRSVRVCAEYRPPGSTLGYRLSTPEHKGRFTLKLNCPPLGAMLRPQSRPNTPDALSGATPGTTPSIEGGAHPGLTPGTPPPSVPLRTPAS